MITTSNTTHRQAVGKAKKKEYSKTNFSAWNSFKALKNNYSHTQYYQDVLAECGYFNTFVNQEK